MAFGTESGAAYCSTQYAAFLFQCDVRFHISASPAGFGRDLQLLQINIVDRQYDLYLPLVLK